jgi:hypothetical protein
MNYRPHYDDYDDYYESREDGDKVQTLYRATTHTARRDHGDGHIKKGDRYRRMVTGGYTVNGPRWMNVSKHVVQRAEEVAA